MYLLSIYIYCKTEVEVRAEAKSSSYTKPAVVRI